MKLVKLLGLLLMGLMVVATACAATATREAEDLILDEESAGILPPLDGHTTWTHPPIRIRPHPPMTCPRVRRAPMSTRNLTTVLMSALDNKNVMLLLLMTDPRALIAYHSDLPTGGLYKGRRGVLELIEAGWKGVNVTNSSYKIIAVDEERNTATVVKTVSGVSRKTNTAFTARKMITIEFALQRVMWVAIQDLDYDVVKNALSTPAEKACARLCETAFVNGPLSSAWLALIADNVSIEVGAVSPKTLATISGKADLIHHLQNKTDTCKLIECLYNHTTYSNVVHADNSRVVTINFAGNFLHARKYVDRFSEGTIIHGVDRIDDQHSVVVFLVMHEFDTDGKLTRAITQLSRPLTLLDRVHLRDVHGINITMPTA